MTTLPTSEWWGKAVLHPVCTVQVKIWEAKQSRGEIPKLRCSLRIGFDPLLTHAKVSDSDILVDLPLLAGDPGS